MALKIAQICPYGWNRAGGVREHTQQLAAHLIALGHQVSVLAPALSQKVALPGGKVYNLGHTIPFTLNGTTMDIAVDPAMPGRVRQVLAWENFDIVHIHEPLLPGLSLAVLGASKAVTVGTFHTFPYDEQWSIPALAYALAAPLLRTSFRRLDGRIAVSVVAAQFISRFFPADYQVIPNGIDLERFHPGVEPLPHLLDGKYNILFVGRFDRRKGMKYLLEAIPRIRTQYPNTRFLFVGEGPLRPRLQAIARQQGWPDVVFTGYVPPEVLPCYFASAHVFCSPATGGESQGIVLLEAMAVGVPIVASNIPGYTTVIKAGVNGTLTTPANSEELASAIIQLLGQEEVRERFRVNGLQKAQQYCWPEVTKHILQYYTDLLALRKQASSFALSS